MLPDQGAVYCPEELSLLGEVLDQVVQSLPRSMATPHNRAAIAKNILACAATGERDPDELRLAAMIDLKVTVAASQTPNKLHHRATISQSPRAAALASLGASRRPLRSMIRKTHP
jgi:hypothetical protein